MAEDRISQIGRYKILGELGRGGFGRVYRAYDPTVGRPVAIKVLTEISNDTLTRFRNEASVAGNLLHGNIVTVYEYGIHGDLPFLAMEYLEGEDLHRLIASQRSLSLLEKCNIMSQVAEGLYCAHKSGVVHRDMKPANIMVLRDGTVKIMDFGIARMTGTPDATRLTQKGYLVGTLRYMAPEQLTGSAVDAQCDIFAYGVIFYELVTGRHPFEAPEAQSLMYKLTFEEPAPMRNFVPHIPEALQQVVSRIIHKDRTLRYQSLQQVQFDTEPIRIELRTRRAASLLTHAQKLLNGKQLDAAQKVLQEALNLEPSNQAGRTLWDNLQQEFRDRSRQPQIESLLKRAEQCLAERRFADAVQAFQSALQLDRSNDRIKEHVEQAAAWLDRATRASQLLIAARREFEGQNVTTAHRMVSEALRHDPRNPDAAELLKTIQEFVDRRRLEQRVDDAIRKAQGLILIPAYDDAIATLTALGPDAESPKVLAFLEQLRTQKTAHERKQRLRSGMAAATDLLGDHRIEEAAKCLEALRMEFPQEHEVADLLAYAQKEQAASAKARMIENARSEARSRMETFDFEGALSLLDGALKAYPGEYELIRMVGSVIEVRGTWERRQAVESTLAKCETFRSQQRFAEAVQAVESGLETHSSEPALLNLLEELQKEWKEHRRRQAVGKVNEQAEKLLAQSQPDAAAQVVQEALLRYPDDEALGRLLKRAQDEVRAKQRARAVEMLKSEAAQYAATHEFDKALHILDEGLRSWPKDAVLVRLRAAMFQEKQSWDRQAALAEKARTDAIQKHVRDARLRTDARDFDGALVLLDNGLRSWPDAASLRELREAILAEREHHAKRQRALHDLEEVRLSAVDASGTSISAELLSLATNIASRFPDDEEVQAAAAEPIHILSDLERVQQETARRNFKEAIEICERHLARLPEHRAFLELKLEAERSQRRAIMDELHRRASGEPNLERRAQVLEEALDRFPDESAIADELRLTRNKLRLADSIVEQARTCEGTGRWEEAIEKWNSLLTIHGHYPGLEAEIARVQRARDKAHSDAVELRAQEIDQAMRAGALDRAAELSRRALAEHPGAARLQESARRIFEIEEKRKRTRKLLTRARRANENGRYDESRTLLIEAFQVDESNAPLRDFLRKKLIDGPQSAVEADWRQAETLVVAALPFQLDPVAPVPAADSLIPVAEPPANTGPPRMPGDSAKRLALNRKWLLAGISVCILSLAGIVVVHVLRVPAVVVVRVTANVPGSVISVDKEKCVTPNCNLKLLPGTYTLQAAANGYQTTSRSLTIAPGQAAIKLALALESLPQLLQVNTNFETGEVYLDGQLQGELRDGQYSASGIAPGQHVIRVKGSGTDFQAEWKSNPGEVPELLQLTPGKNLEATVVANAGAAGSISCNCDAQKIAVDGVAAAHAPASTRARVPLGNLREGARQISVGGRSMVVDIRSNPALNLFLSIDRNVGGKREDFVSPPPRTLSQKKGEEKAVTFALSRVPAHLDIAGAIPGTQVRLDGQLIGEIDKGGVFRHEVAPGNHSIELTKENYEPIRANEEFRPGLTVQLDRARLAMVKKAVAPSPDAKQVEAQEWVRLSSSTNPDEFDEFIRNHPRSAYVEQARTRAGELRIRAQANTTRQIEQAAWDRVDQNSKEQLQNYLSGFPAGAHAQNARSRIAELERSAANILAAQRQKDQKDQEQAKSVSDLQAILKVLRDFTTAYNGRDLETLQKLWSGVPIAAYRQQFREARDLQFQLQSTSPPVVNGNTAMAICTRTLTYRGQSGGSQTHSEKVLVTLSRDASGWVIRSIQRN